MPAAAQQHSLQMFGVPVHSTGYKTGIGTHSQSQWVKRMVDTAKWRALGNFLFSSEVGEYCPLVKTINLVVEQ